MVGVPRLASILIAAGISASCARDEPRPIVTLIAEPPIVTGSGSTRLKWNSARAKACTASGAWSGTKATSGFETVAAIASARTFSITCSNRGGAETKSVTVYVQSAPPPAVPTVSLRLDPNVVDDGALATLEWTSDNATSCRASGAWSGVRATVGSETIGPVRGSRVFSLSCSGPGGTASQSVAAQPDGAVPLPPPPDVTLSLDRMVVTSGTAATIAWSAKRSSSCVASGAWSGPRPAAGSEATGPLHASSTFSLSCTGPGGTVSRTVAIHVSAPPPLVPTLTFAAVPSTIRSGEGATLTWAASNASSCAASGTWSGTKPAVGWETTGPLMSDRNYSLTCVGDAGAVTKSLTVFANPAMAPTVSLRADPIRVAVGASATLTWHASNADVCEAQADTSESKWGGVKPLAGSENTGPLTASSYTFSLTCTGRHGSASQSIVVAVGDAPTQTGLDFPGNAGVKRTLRFRFQNPLPIYPATYIWRAYPKRQAGYYTTFFWANDDGQNNLNTVLWLPGGGADSYYGVHPYPNPAPGGGNHDWELSVEREDFVNGRVVYDRWHTQALVVWADQQGKKHHEFYWDLPNIGPSHRVVRVSEPDWGTRLPPFPALTWGDAPWAPGEEVFHGVLRGIQIYSTRLSLADILTEARSPLSTEAGAANIWYLNLDPRPDDIADKSGRGNHPSWVGDERPRLWTGP